MKVYEFTTRQAAEQCLAAINGMAAQFWTENNFTVVDESGTKQLVGKKNGVDNPSAARTVTWAVVKESPDNTFYFASLSNKPEFVNGTQQLIDAGFVFTEKDFPAEWIPVGEA